MESTTIAFQDIAYQIDFKTNSPIVHIFGRNIQDKTPTHTILTNCKPYFYVPENEVDRLNGCPELDLEPLDGCRPGESYTDIFGRPVRRIYTDLPGRVAKVRDRFSFTDESDILFERRVIVDKKIRSGFTEDLGIITPITIDYVPPRILFFDIEVRAPRGVMPSAQTVKYPISTIQIKDSYTGKKFVITCGVPSKQRSNHIPADTETELYEIFYQLLKKIDPDILTGWYTNQFDLPYLIRRETALGIGTKGLCRINDVRCDLMPNKKYIVKVPGRQCFDMLDGFKKLKGSESEREDYGLKTISAEYGFPYKDYGAYIDEIYTNEDWSTLLTYCENDVDSLSIIEKETEMFQFFESVRYITGCKLEDTLHNSRIIETFLMHEGIAPMPRKRKVEGDPYEGAFVLEPPIGIHEHVGWVDLAALYPTIMRAFNLSPDKEKIVPRVLTFIVEERERLRAINKSPAKTKNTEYQEMVMKYLANSFYGVLGSKDFRLYNEEIASKVTEYGRIISERVRDECIRLGYTPVYGDTDSVAVTSVLSVNEGIILQNRLNSMLKQWSLENNALVTFSLKFEKLHRSLLFKPDRTGKKAAKKRYAGKLIWSDKDGDCNKLNYTGIELKRSDQSKLTKQLLREFLEITLIEGDLEKGMAHVRTTHKRVKSGQISIYDVSIPKGVYSDREDPWVRGKHTAEHDYGHIFDPSVKMRLVYLKPREGKPVEVCIDDEFDLSQISNLIDWNMHAEKSIQNKLSSYMEALGYTWSYVVDGQQTLF